MNHQAPIVFYRPPNQVEGGNPHALSRMKFAWFQCLSVQYTVRSGLLCIGRGGEQKHHFIVTFSTLFML